MNTMVADPLNGALLDGRYRVRGRVARGGMATVYHATDERLERTVAIKIIHPAQARDGQFVARFAEEAKTVARLTHPNVVAVYDQGVHAGMPYLVMEYVRGRTLREILTERRRLHPHEALAILEQVLAAVAVAHRAGLVHRDVKPENVLVSPPPNGSGDLIDAVVKVADFGLAMAVEASAEETDGQLLATVAYVAPELVANGHADPRTDVYSAGIVLFEMLTGRVPYDGERPVDVAWQHVDRDVPPPSKFVTGLPALLDDLVARATRRDPGGRPMDAGAMLAEVQSAREDLGTVNRAPNRSMAGPTMEMIPVDQRPSWARLPVRNPTADTPPNWEAQPTPRTRPFSVLLTGVATRLRRLQRTQQGRRKLIAAMIALGLVVLVGGYWFLIGRYTDAPPLQGATKENAIVEAHRLGFDVSFGTGIYSEQVPKDTVIRQQPAPGGRVVRGGTILLQLSLGPERYVVPDIAGQLVDTALPQLKEHFDVEQVNGYSDTLPVGFVVGTDPAIGKSLAPGTKVKVIVAKGPYPMHVPGVVGRNLFEARAILEQNGFTVGEVKEKDGATQPRNQVIDQDPAEGQGVTKGTTVNLTVSKGPPSLPMPNVENTNCQDAKRLLEGQGFVVQVDVQGPFGENGTVRRQEPGPGQEVPSGQTVILRCRFF
jgi:serine/threonine-protein kinase